MARIVYALTSQGRGHSSRVTAMAEALEARGHTLLFCAGGGAGKLLASTGREVIDVPVLRHEMHDNRIRLWKSLFMILSKQWSTRGVVDEVIERFRAFEPDLLITDFESYSIQAAQRMGLPLMTFNHQQVLTHTRFEVPGRYAWDAWVARLVINNVSPNNAERVLISSFFYPPLRHPERADRRGGATLVAPILRRAVQDVEPTLGEHVLVYHNDPTGMDGLIAALAGNPEQRFIAYNLGRLAERPGFTAPANVQLEEPNVEGFLAHLASAKAVICSAGFTLTSEALFLGKPMLVLPNGGIFEQTLNAIYLVRDGLGEAVMNGRPTAEDVGGFLSRLDRYAVRDASRLRCGNDDAVACIESVLADLGAA
ncbi:teichoic acid biosynthesis related protein [Plesiocystis pacifica SIR-1]|uniref:Teichoic acid biosynthesis related protein n=1 Tax=Plesiocystis pacifica SIR-1 TaxID=391625 RepID=A6G4C9_9BACT|nr:glycosyltransferase family protein [Plesiocystis pacifica]EDM79241.1 teichoic acid biosynthesis related protein [Plesiocystis pacifica SIR-1]